MTIWQRPWKSCSPLAIDSSSIRASRHPRGKGVVVLSASHLLPLQNQVKLASSQTQNLIPDSGTACHNTSFHSEKKMPYLPYMALHAWLKVNKTELVTPGWEFPCKCTVGCNQSPLLTTSGSLDYKGEKDTKDSMEITSKYKHISVSKRQQPPLFISFCPYFRH